MPTLQRLLRVFHRHHQEPTLPGCLATRSAGHVVVTPNADDELMRDLARVCHGGRLFVVARRRVSPALVDAMEDVNTSACQKIFATLSNTINAELSAQIGIASRRSWFRVPRRSKPQQTEELMKAIATHVSIGPGLQVVQLNGLPPALWQPMYAICVGAGQVRVVTYAFVGGPVVGDRPDRKRTPYILRLVTSDLAAVASEASLSNYSAHAAEAETTLDHFVRQESTLFDALDSGDWSSMGVRTRFTSTFSTFTAQ